MTHHSQTSENKDTEKNLETALEKLHLPIWGNN